MYIKIKKQKKKKKPKNFYYFCSDFIEEWVKICLPAKERVKEAYGNLSLSEQCTACEKVSSFLCGKSKNSDFPHQRRNKREMCKIGELSHGDSSIHFLLFLSFDHMWKYN